MTDCSSIQGSTSSSSDVMTLTTAASSWCAMPTNSRIRVLRLVRPHHTRRMLIVTGPESNPSYGFAVRGGKEFGTGFFVSQVERNSEADLKGLRIGDQILRLNGFRVEDAVHKEFIRFVSSQDRITLKVRGVGMLPIKDKESERLSWNVVKIHSISNTPSESSFKTVTTEHSSSCSAIGVGDLRCKDISVVLDVAPRTKLGLGICKGPEWKPGIFVQFTKEKSVAREAGLRPGDQILSVNSIDFSDVLFSEAVAVMKSSNKLEMIVRTAAGCDLFPGESSGYNSSASSVTGDQSPCWADAKSKRLTAVHEEPSVAVCWNEALYAEQRCNGILQQSRDTRNTTTSKKLNKTIIKLSENGTSINNTYVANPHSNSCLGAPLKPINAGQHENTLTKTTSSVQSSLPSTMCIYSNVEQPGKSRHMQQSLDTARGISNKTSVADVHRNQQFDEEKHKQMNQANLQRNTSKMTSSSSSSATAVSSSKTIGPPKAPSPALYSNLANKSSDDQNTAKSNNMNELGATGSTLSSAITEELKKRREKQRFSNSTNNADSIINNNNNNNNNCTSKSNNSRTENQQAKTIMTTTTTTTSTVTMQRHQQHQHQQNQHYHHHSAQHQHQHHQQQQQQHQEHKQQTVIASPTKRAPSSRALSSNAANCNDRNGNICSNANGTGNSTLDQHSALMDEFKRAHQRMFKNGFHESDRKERQEALKRTSIMEDDSSHRTSRQFLNEKSSITDIAELQQQAHQQNVPPPPPQFANSPPKNQSNNIYGVNYQTVKKLNNAPQVTASINNKQPNTNASKPPNSPTPDYDNVDFRKGRQSQMHDASANNNKITSNTTSAGNTNANRRTMRLGAVTIGEYEPQRKEPTKFEFVVGNKNRDTSNGYSNSRNIENLHSELHDTLTRSKLKNGSQIEHQRDCPLRNGNSYANGNGNGNGIDQLTRKIQGVQLNEGVSTVKRQSSSTTANGTGPSTGILKNGNNRNSNSNSNGLNSHSTKMVEKTITFGN